MLKVNTPMNVVFDIVAPIFGIVVFGYSMARFGWFSSRSAEGVSNFVFNFVVPLMLFSTLAKTSIPNDTPWALFASFYIGAVTIFILGILLGKIAFNRDAAGRAITGFACAFGNSVLLGFPLILATFGEAGTVPFFLLLSVHGLSFFTIITILLELAHNHTDDSTSSTKLVRLLRNMAKGMFTNPIMLGIFAGTIFNIFSLPIPKPAQSIIDIMEQALIPCALFSLGATLTQYSFKGRLGQSLVVASLKLMMMPFLVWLLATQVFDLSPLWAGVAVLLAGQPAGINVFLFAQRYGTGQAVASTTIFLSTAMSLGTLSAILYLLDIKP
jgi:predicted permease